ncbi:MAG: L-histidine N(alpha)-methyltransferase [Cyanobacteria bacterium J06639_1]
MDRPASLDRVEAAPSLQPNSNTAVPLSFDALPSDLDSRLAIDNRLTGTTQNYEDAIAGLSAISKWLPSTYFYDERGSQLFEQICQLPEYYPTRTEAAILERVAVAIADRVGRTELFELGSGSSTKTRLLLDVFSDRGSLSRYVPVDVSSEMLIQSAKTLLAAYPSLRVRAVADDYFHVWDRLPVATAKRTVVFLGSTLGNLDPQSCDRFLSKLSAAVDVGDYFLLGIDLQKPVAILEAAYNDSQGVTAEFNLNLLRHLNCRLSGDFELTQFAHRAFYNREQHQIEMHLVSQIRQTVTLKAIDLVVELEAGESIRTEISRKFDLADMERVLKPKGWTVRDRWTDDRQWFGLMLLQKT